MKILLLSLFFSTLSFANLEKVKARKGSSKLKYFCSSLDFYDKGRVDKTAFKEFKRENKCKGAILLTPLQVLGIKKDFQNVSCERGQKTYVISLSKKCLPESLEAKDVGVIENLGKFLSKYRPKRVH